MGTTYTGQVINFEIPLGLALLLFYIILGFFFWEKRGIDRKKVKNIEIIFMFVKVVLTIATIIVSAYVAVLSVMILLSAGIHPVIAYIAIVVLPSLLLPLIWMKKRKKLQTRMLSDCWSGVCQRKDNISMKKPVLLDLCRMT